MKKLFEIENLRCSYDKNYIDGVSKIVLNIRRLVLPKGKNIFIVGESGIGKSTVLEVLGLMNNTIVPDSETKFFFYENDTPVDLMELWRRNNDKELSEVRRRHFNFIFQSTNLMRNFTAYENITITRMLQGYDRKSSFEKASIVLNDLGLGHIDENRMAQELSGGQQQRLAFARAIIPDFTVLFGDEPTGNLDSDNAIKAMQLLTDKLQDLNGSSAIIVSHDMNLAASFADIVIKIHKKTNLYDKSIDDASFYGLIDDDCIYTPNATRTIWSNGSQSYSNDEFVSFLKHRDDE